MSRTVQVLLEVPDDWPDKQVENWLFDVCEGGVTLGGVSDPPGRVILVAGNPLDGLTFGGPFQTSEDASAYAERTGVETDWWVAEVESTEPEAPPVKIDAPVPAEKFEW